MDSRQRLLDVVKTGDNNALVTQCQIQPPLLPWQTDNTMEKKCRVLCLNQGFQIEKRYDSMTLQIVREHMKIQSRTYEQIRLAFYKVKYSFSEESVTILHCYCTLETFTVNSHILKLSRDIQLLTSDYIRLLNKP